MAQYNENNQYLNNIDLNVDHNAYTTEEEYDERFKILTTKFREINKEKATINEAFNVIVAQLQDLYSNCKNKHKEKFQNNMPIDNDDDNNTVKKQKNTDTVELHEPKSDNSDNLDNTKKSKKKDKKKSKKKKKKRKKDKS